MLRRSLRRSHGAPGRSEIFKLGKVLTTFSRRSAVAGNNAAALDQFHDTVDAFATHNYLNSVLCRFERTNDAVKETIEMFRT